VRDRYIIKPLLAVIDPEDLGKRPVAGITDVQAVFAGALEDIGPHEHGGMAPLDSRLFFSCHRVSIVDLSVTGNIVNDPIPE
jgi:hypothetical protein